MTALAATAGFREVSGKEACRWRAPGIADEGLRPSTRASEARALGCDRAIRALAVAFVAETGGPRSCH